MKTPRLLLAALFALAGTTAALADGYNYSFPYDQHYTGKGGQGLRYTPTVSLQGSESGLHSVNTLQVSGTDCPLFSDLTETVWKVVPGETLTPSLDYQGEWMHKFVYIDYGQDGNFDVHLTGSAPYGIGENNDLVSWGYIDGYDSHGTSHSGNYYDNPPSFVLPADLAPGRYRCRFKVDWNDPTPYGTSKDFRNSSGMMADVTLLVPDEVPPAVVTEQLTLSYALNDGLTVATVTVEGLTGQGSTFYFLDDEPEPYGFEGNSFEVAAIATPAAVKVTVREANDDMSVVYAEGELTINFPNVLFSTTDAAVVARADLDAEGYTNFGGTTPSQLTVLYGSFVINNFLGLGNLRCEYSTSDYPAIALDSSSDGIENALRNRYIESFQVQNSDNDFIYVNNVGTPYMRDIANGISEADADKSNYIFVKNHMLKVHQGQDVRLTLMRADTGDGLFYCTARGYADWDGSKDFDESGDEVILALGESNAKRRNSDFTRPYSWTMHVPEDAKPGISRLRFVFSDAWFPHPGSAGLHNKGFAIDFAMEITGDNPHRESDVEVDELAHITGVTATAESSAAVRALKAPGSVGSVELGGRTFSINSGEADLNEAAGYVLLDMSEGSTQGYYYTVWGDIATAVSDSKSATARPVVYNLNGQRVAKPTNGLYIVGGKKAVVK